MKNLIVKSVPDLEPHTDEELLEFVQLFNDLLSVRALPYTAYAVDSWPASPPERYDDADLRAAWLKAADMVRQGRSEPGHFEIAAALEMFDRAGVTTAVMSKILEALDDQFGTLRTVDEWWGYIDNLHQRPENTRSIKGGK